MPTLGPKVNSINCSCINIFELQDSRHLVPGQVCRTIALWQWKDKAGWTKYRRDGFNALGNQIFFSLCLQLYIPWLLMIAKLPSFQLTSCRQT